MKKRTPGFLSEENISHNSEVFSYIQELHDYLWGFVRTVKPYASGNLEDFIDSAVSETLPYEQIKSEREQAIDILKDINGWLCRAELAGTAHQRMVADFLEKVRQ